MCALGNSKAPEHHRLAPLGRAAMQQKSSGGQRDLILVENSASLSDQDGVLLPLPGHQSLHCKWVQQYCLAEGS